METSIRLLMPDGAVRVTFRPILLPDQYTDLMERVKKQNTLSELRREMTRAAKEWKRKVEFNVEP